MMADYIKEYFQHFGVSPEVQEVTLHPLPTAIQRLDIPVDRQNSYKTAADYLLNLHELDFDDLHYVAWHHFQPLFLWQSGYPYRR